MSTTPSGGDWIYVHLAWKMKIQFEKYLGFPGGSDDKESTCRARDLGVIPGLGRSPGGGHGNPLQCSCLENPMDRGASRATVPGVSQSDTTERLSTEQYHDFSSPSVIKLNTSSDAVNIS